MRRMDPPEHVFVSDEEYERRRFGYEVKRSWAAYLSRYEWDSFVTLTAPMWSPSRLLVAFRGYVRHLTRAAQQPVRYFVIVETGGSGVAHVHALLWGTARLTQPRLETGWRPGFARADAFDETRGAAAYVTKEIEQNADEWALSEKLPPLRAPKPPVRRSSEVVAAPP